VPATQLPGTLTRALLGTFNYNGQFTGNPTAGLSIGYDFADFFLDYSAGVGISGESGTWASASGAPRTSCRTISR
jgi:hypothetical protein